MSVSVVVLAFNEEQSLAAVVREIDSVLRTLDRNYKVLIIDDGSTDKTATIAEDLAKDMVGVQVIHHTNNQGLGGGYRTGFGEAKGDFIIFFPADGQFPAAIIKRFLPVMDKADMVLGYLPNRNSSLLARSLSRAEKVVYRLLLGPLPKFQGVLMFRRKLLDDIELKSTGRGWAVLLELIIRASRGGYRLVSVPTEMRPRMSGKSKVNNLCTIWANLKQVIALCRYL
jgi:glycosyltransferase involved in cell wall biosynthesis